MIKIDRTPSPVVKAKIAAFKADHNLVVWREPYIIRNLLAMSHSKCCYCECNIDEESKYMEVEHFHHKDKYEDEVVDWNNLLPSCKACNVHKGNHDTVTEPIVDPSKQDPRDHLVFYAYQLRGKTDIGEMTENVLNLNDYKHHALPRFKICNKLTDTLGDLLNVAKNLSANTPKSNKTHFRNRMIHFLELCQPDEPYTAIKATVVTNDKKYNSIVTILQAQGMWDSSLVALDATMRRYKLDIEK